MSGGSKFDNDKPKLSYIPKEALWEMGKAFGYGVKKYGGHNFKGGIEYTRLCDAAMRHIIQFVAGEDLDKESGNSHLGHALASLAMLAYMVENHKNLDDRFKKPNRDDM